MSLVQQLLEKEKRIELTYYGMNDMATGFHMKNVVESKDIICGYFEMHHNMKIETLDNYIEYNYALKISKMKEIIPNIIDDDKKDAFVEIVSTVDKYLDTIATSEIVKYINNYYKTLFEKNEIIMGLIDATLLLFERYKSGIKLEVIQYVIEKHAYLIVGHYNVFGPMIERNEFLLELFFSASVISNIFLQKQIELQKILEKVYCKRILKNFENLINVLAEIIEEKYLDITDDNILVNEIYIRNFVEFLSRIKHIKANLFVGYYNQVTEKMDDYLQRKGYHSTYEIPVGEIIHHLKCTEPKEYRLLTVSHGVKDGKILSRLEFSSEGKHTMMDFAASNHKTDDYYTMSHLHRLEISVMVGASTIHGMLFDDEMFDESRRCLLGYIFAICEIKQWSKEDYQDDVETLYQMLNMCRQMPEINDVDLTRGICYGTSAFICGLMEKILRDIYVEENRGNLYIDETQITMGQLLRDDLGIIGSIFTKHQLKHLRYYLSTDTEEKIGFSYRNKIAHYTIDKRNLNISFVAKMMYFLVDVVNSIFLYVQI